MTISTEHLILSNLARNNEFISHSLPFLKQEYFHDKIEKEVFNTIIAYLHKYNTEPNLTTLLIDIKSNDRLNENEIKQAETIVKGLFVIEKPSDESWLLKQAEEFCRNKAVYNAIMKSISIYEGEETQITTGAIPDLLKDAVSISFDSKIGMDFHDDFEARYEYYTMPESKIPFDIELLNRITNGGVGRKTLNLIVAGINVGKTLGMVHLACSYAKQGLNVLYITMEMREEEIFKRIDANLMNIPINTFEAYGKDRFMTKVDRIKSLNYGKIKVKEYPPGGANVNHFKSLLNDLSMKQRFKPDVILVDYLGLVGSSRLKAANTNSYFYLKAVAEELRALAVETDAALWSAVQLTRNSQNSSDTELSDIGESMGIPATADFMVGFSRSEELDAINQLHVKQMKNRYGNKTDFTRFVIGVDLMLQRLYSVNNSEQNGIVDSSQLYKPNTPSTVSQPVANRNKFAVLDG